MTDFFLLLLLPLISSVIGSIRIPIVNEAVNVTLSTSHGLSVVMNLRLSPGRLSSPAMERPHPEDPEVVYYVSLVDAIGQDVTITERVIFFPPMGTNTSFIGIGSASSTVGFRGAAFVLRRNETSELVLTDASTNFLENCVDGSAIHIPSRSRLVATIDIESINLRIPNLIFTVNYVANDGLLAVPRDLLTSLSAILIRLGATRHGSPENYSVYENCGDEFFESFPEISIQIESGILVIRPTDYIRAYVESRTCELLVTHSEDGTSSFNPLLLPFTNVRFTRRGVDICDSSLFD